MPQLESCKVADLKKMQSHCHAASLEHTIHQKRQPLASTFCC
uniref:Uncharacterized protein n=1 Tax=Arundo donax TaxID=35708 RepID=A0A0A9B0H7_ARUDO